MDIITLYYSTLKTVDIVKCLCVAVELFFCTLSATSPPPVDSIWPVLISQIRAGYRSNFLPNVSPKVRNSSGAVQRTYCDLLEDTYTKQLQGVGYGRRQDCRRWSGEEYNP